MGTAALEHDFTALKSLGCNSDPVLGPLLLLVLYTLLYNRLGEKILDYVNTKRSSKKAGVGAMNTGNMYPKEGKPALRVSSHRARNQQARPWKCSLG